KGSKLTIMSGQGGFIISQLAQKHPQGFNWVDLWGLSDRTFTQCPPAREIQLIPLPSWDYSAYFRILPEIRKQCPDFREPDIIFDLHDVVEESLLVRMG